MTGKTYAEHYAARLDMVKQAQQPVNILAQPGMAMMLERTERGVKYRQYILGGDMPSVPLTPRMSCRFTKPVVVTQVPSLYPANTEERVADVVLANDKTSLVLEYRSQAEVPQPADTPIYGMAKFYNSQNAADTKVGSFLMVNKEVKPPPHQVQVLSSFFGKGAGEAERLENAYQTYRETHKALGITCTHTDAVLTPAALLHMAKGSVPGEPKR